MQENSLEHDVQFEGQAAHIPPKEIYPGLQVSHVS